MKKLSDYANSSYIQAYNRLNGRSVRRKIVVYVEGYDDIHFWSSVLKPLETEEYYFEVMLPSRSSLGHGKRVVLSNQLGRRLGNYMIACVDADYDYLLNGSTNISQFVCNNPYVFHTYAYAIENLQCYAPSLQGVCTMATLNDHRVFDFEAFLAEYSRIIFPLFVWNVWAYRYGEYKGFTLSDFFAVIQMNDINTYHPERNLQKVQHFVNAKIAKLQKRYQQARKTWKPLRDELLEKGVLPEETYLYIRGHDLFDGIVAPLLSKICEQLRRERENDIRKFAKHDTQMQNELAGYQHATAPSVEMLRKHTGYAASPIYKRIQKDVQAFLHNISMTKTDENSNFSGDIGTERHNNLGFSSGSAPKRNDSPDFSGGNVAEGNDNSDTYF